uniref:MIF4G domain-containing protein n=1 Tax=Angiostrongylus cantonensis TaxID=6313 RepID=A0A158PAW2_ANGCA
MELTTKSSEPELKIMDVTSTNAPTNGGSGRKTSTGLVPSLNRLRIQQCFKAARKCAFRPTIGEAILKRATSNRPEMRTFMNRLTEQQIELMGKQFYTLIAHSVENIERPELDDVCTVYVKVQQHARTLGETYAALCRLGFRPDYFTSLADAAIAECVKLDGGAHKRCETLLAWSQLIGTIFTSVRDGYYNRVRYQRRSVLSHCCSLVIITADCGFEATIDRAFNE